MSRAHRILAHVAGAARPVTFDSICSAAEPAADYKLRSYISAQLHQLVNTGKLRRSGQPRAYRYSATATTLVDCRRFKDGKPRDRSAQRARERQAKARAKPAPKPAPPPKPRRQATPVPAQRAVYSSKLKPAAPRAPGERETVEEFQRRGGRIQKLKPGESSSPLYESVRALNDKTMRKRLAEADNDTDLDDADDIAAIAHA